VFGPGERRKGKMASMAWHLAQQMLGGSRPRLFEHGEHARDQVYIKDVVAQTIASAGPGVTPGIYNCGSGRVTTFNEIAEALGEALGLPSEPEYFAMPEGMVPTYQHYTCADMTAAADGLGWTPSMGPAEGIADYAAWMKAEHERTTRRTQLASG
jgi:ADP-L-glycero-D-manno-heptose 6-epimerase